MEKENLTAGIATLTRRLTNNFKEKLEKVKAPQLKKIIVSTVAGDGTAGFHDGPALTAKFKSPLDVAVSADGTIYVADGFNSCIRKIKYGQVTTFAGNGSANISNGNSTAARFKIPTRLTLDVAGNIYTLDAADPRLRKITPAADVSTYAGTNTFGFRDGDASIAHFGQSFGIVADIRGNIYIADSQNNNIRRINIAGQVTTIAGTGVQGFMNGGIETALFYFVKGIVIDKGGNLFVSDYNRVRKISTDGIVSTFAGSSMTGYTDGKVRTARFSQIEAMVMNEQGDIYLTEGNRIRKISSRGIVSTVAGSTAGYQDGDAASAKFNQPKGLGIDKQGNIYVADDHNNRIRKISFE